MESTFDLSTFRSFHLKHKAICWIGENIKELMKCEGVQQWHRVFLMKPTCVE